MQTLTLSILFVFSLGLVACSAAGDGRDGPEFQQPLVFADGVNAAVSEHHDVVYFDGPVLPSITGPIFNAPQALVFSPDPDVAEAVSAAVDRFRSRLGLDLDIGEGGVHVYQDDLQAGPDFYIETGLTYIPKGGCRFEECGPKGAHIALHRLMWEEGPGGKDADGNRLPGYYSKYIATTTDHEVGHVLTDLGLELKTNMHLTNGSDSFEKVDCSVDGHPIMCPASGDGDWKQADVNFWCATAPCQFPYAGQFPE